MCLFAHLLPQVSEFLFMDPEFIQGVHPHPRQVYGDIIYILKMYSF